MTPALQHTFRALADPTRRDILRRLSARDMSLSEVTEYCTMTRAAVKKHLIVLEQGNLIHMRRQGRETISTLNADGLRPVMDWLAYFERFWDGHLGALEELINKAEDPET